MPSPGGSPFIPPLPDVPGGSPVRAPVIPPFSPPQQSHQGTPAYNAYLSPYGTPYAPSMTFSPPGGPPPGPSQPHTGGRGGFSSDYVGYGNTPAAPPQATPYPAAPPGGTPYHPGGQFYGGPPPQAPPAAQGWGPPMQAWAPFQYPPSTGQSYPVPLPGQPPYAFPPQQMYWPPQGGVPGPTPGYAPGPIPMMYTGPPPPMAPPAAPREPPLSRADRFDVGFVFGEGTSYGPALRPAHIQALGVHLRVNPLLKPVDDSDPEDRKSLVWNMLFSSSDCYLSGDPIHRSWTTGRDSPATFPRVTHLRLISSTFPWTVDIQATKPTAGVTCGDLIDQVFTYFHARVPQSVYDTLSREQKNAVKNIYHYNRSRADGVPGGRLGEGLKRVDWLNRATMFGGVRVNDMMVVSQLGIALPCTLEVLCQEREELDEPGPEELRARTRGRSHSRRRNSRASSTHPPPAPPSVGRSGATTPN